MSRQQPIKETLKVFKRKDIPLGIEFMQVNQSSDVSLNYRHNIPMNGDPYSSRNRVWTKKNKETEPFVVNRHFQQGAVGTFTRYTRMCMPLYRSLHTDPLKFVNKEVLLSKGRMGDQFFLFDPDQRALNLSGLQPSRAMFQRTTNPRRVEVLNHEQIEVNKKMSNLMDRARVMNLEAEKRRKALILKTKKPRVFRSFSDTELEVTRARLKRNLPPDGIYRETLYDIFNRAVNSRKIKREMPPKKIVRPYTAVPRIHTSFDKNVRTERGLDLLQKNLKSKPTNINSIKIGNTKSRPSSMWKNFYRMSPTVPKTPLHKKKKNILNKDSSKNGKLSMFFSNRYKGKPRFVSLELLEGGKQRTNDAEKTKSIENKVESSKKNNKFFNSKAKKSFSNWMVKNKEVTNDKPKKRKLMTPPTYKGKPYSLRHDKNTLAKQLRNDIENEENRKLSKISSHSKRDFIGTEEAVTTTDVSSRTSYEPSASHKNAFDRFLKRLHPDSVEVKEPNVVGRKVLQKSVSFMDSYATAKKNSFLSDKPRSPFQKSPGRNHGLKGSLYSKKTDAKGRRPGEDATDRISRSSGFVAKQVARKFSARRFSSLPKSSAAERKVQYLDAPPALDGGRNFLSRLIRWWDQTAN